MTDKDDKQDIKVTDKRRFKMDDKGEVSARTEKEAQEKNAAEQPSPEQKDILDDMGPCGEDDFPCDECAEDYKNLPPLDFISFVFSLTTATMAYLGFLPDPMTQKITKNLALAKQHIDLLGMLQDKTKGNLSTEEDKFLRNSLYDLRLKFVESCQGK